MKLLAGAINVFVFGPGYGEFIAVHVPPDGWLAIDGCAAGGVPYAPLFFDRLNVTPTHVMMTHPHLDHAKGIVDLIEKATRGAPTTWPRLGVFEPPRQRPSRRNAVAAFETKVALQVLNAMKTRWRRNPACRWDLSVGSTEPVGAGEVRVLSPETVPEKMPKHFDWNSLSTALDLTWNNHRLILGSDLVESPGKGWSKALTRFGPLPFRALKIAHHGSLEAQHGPLLGQHLHRASVFVATPFTNSRLPRFGPGEGIAMLQRHSARLLLTGLPQKYEDQSGQTRTLKRSALHRMEKKGFGPDTPARGFPDCYVQLTLNAPGQLNVRAHGPGSVVILPG